MFIVFFLSQEITKFAADFLNCLVMDATKEQIERLIKETSETIGVLYTTIPEDIALLEACDDSVSPLLRLVRELRMDVSFILVDLHAAVHSLLSTEKPIEKRLHLMFISADILECYKLLRNFGKMRKHTIWTKIGKEINTSMETCQENNCVLLHKLYNVINSEFMAIEGALVDKVKRDMTFHYDKDLLNVYRYIIEINSEEVGIERVIQFLGLAQSLLFFCNIAEAIEASKGYTLPVISNRPGTVFCIQKLIAEKMDSDGKIRKALNHTIDKALHIDEAAKMKEGVERVKNYVKANCPQLIIPEIDNMVTMANIHLLLQISLADITTATIAYLNAGSEPEYPLVLRRLTITRVSTLRHICGYDEFEGEKSLWKDIINMVPENNKIMIAKAKAITSEIEGLIDAKDKDDRLLYVHLIDNDTNKSNVPLIIDKIENMNPLAELEKAKALVEVMNKMQRFLKELMGELGKNAHVQAERSKAELKSTIKAIRDVINKSNCFNPQCKEFSEQFDRFDNFVDSIYRI